MTSDRTQRWIERAAMAVLLLVTIAALLLFGYAAGTAFDKPTLTKETARADTR